MKVVLTVKGHLGALFCWSIIIDIYNQTQQIINNSMKHFIYKTTHKNGKYYIGRHSTDDLNDGYVGSGIWVSEIKDKSSLFREILEYAESFEQLIELENKYLIEHYGKPNCMNMSNKSTGWAVGSANPMNNPEVVAKFKGDNHWTSKNPELLQRAASINSK